MGFFSRFVGAIKAAAQTVRTSFTKTQEKRAIKKVAKTTKKTTTTFVPTRKQNIDTQAPSNGRINDLVIDFFRSDRLTASQKANGEKRTPKQQYARDIQAHFYEFTKPLWIRGDKAMRNENILAALSTAKLQSGKYVENMQDAILWVKENDGGTFPKIRNADNGQIDTTDSTFAEGEEQDSGSPPYMTQEAFRALGVSI